MNTFAITVITVLLASQPVRASTLAKDTRRELPPAIGQVQVADVTTNVTGKAIHEIFLEIDRLQNTPPSEEDTAADIQAMARRIDDTTMTVVVVGDRKRVERELRPYGTVVPVSAPK